MSPFQRNGAQLNVEVENSRGSFRTAIYAYIFAGRTRRRNGPRAHRRQELNLTEFRGSPRDWLTNCALRRALVGSESRISRESRASRLMPGGWRVGRLQT